MELTAHSVQLPGIQEVVGVVFWEIPAHSFNLVKEEQYKGSDAVIGIMSVMIYTLMCGQALYLKVLYILCHTYFLQCVNKSYHTHHCTVTSVV